MTPIIPSLSPLFEFQLPRNISGTDFGTGYGGTVCGFHTRPDLFPSLVPYSLPIVKKQPETNSNKYVCAHGGNVFHL